MLEAGKLQPCVQLSASSSLSPASTASAQEILRACCSQHTLVVCLIVQLRHPADTVPSHPAELMLACSADDYLPNGTITDDIPSTTKHISLESYQPREDSFARFISPLTQTYPFMGGQGNHGALTLCC